MKICKLISKTNKIADYCIFGTTKNAIKQSEYDLIEAIGDILLNMLIVVFIGWWLAPIHFVRNKYNNLPNIKFKCEE